MHRDPDAFPVAVFEHECGAWKRWAVDSDRMLVFGDRHSPQDRLGPTGQLLDNLEGGAIFQSECIALVHPALDDLRKQAAQVVSKLAGLHLELGLDHPVIGRGQVSEDRRVGRGRVNKRTGGVLFHVQGEEPVTFLQGVIGIRRVIILQLQVLQAPNRIQGVIGKGAETIYIIHRGLPGEHGLLGISIRKRNRNIVETRLAESEGHAIQGVIQVGCHGTRTRCGKAVSEHRAFRVITRTVIDGEVPRYRHIPGAGVHVQVCDRGRVAGLGHGKDA